MHKINTILLCRHLGCHRAEGSIEHEGEVDDAETKRPGGGLVMEVVVPVHDVVDVIVGADGDERVEAVLGHLVLERHATQP